jgi:putative transposase
MKFDPEKHHRRSIRLPDYNYAQSGAYFVTICTYQKQCWFGDIKQGKMQINQIGQIVMQEWLKSSEIRQEIELDEWVLMPNHLHGIVWIKNQAEDQKKGLHSEGLHSGGLHSGGLHSGGLHSEGLHSEGLHRKPLRIEKICLKSRSLGSFINGFKCSVTRCINRIRNNSDIPFWQRNYYESVIRDEQHLSNIRQYIYDNPQNWEHDAENPHNNCEWQTMLIDVPF